MSLLIRSARLLDPAAGLDGVASLRLRDGRVVELGESLQAADDERVIDASGLWLMPSAIDLCARFREPGAAHKATFASESRAALAAGIGTVVLPPDTRPILDSPAVVDRIHGMAAEVAGPKIHVLGALTQGLAGQALAEMATLRRAGCLGVSQALMPLNDPLVMRRALEYAGGLGLTVHAFAQDPVLAAGGCAHEGAIATRLGLPSIPTAAEVAGLRLWMSLIEDTGGRVHFCRLSTRRGVELVALAKQRGLPVSADVAAHQLFMTDADVEGFNAMAHVVPPLRGVADRDALRAGLADATIDAVCSDHQPHEADAKINPFPLTEPGISALETLLPLSFELVHEGHMPALHAVARLTTGPAAILGLPAPSLQPGAIADLTLLAPQQPWTLDASTLLSAGRNTPFSGHRFATRVICTLRAGEPVAGTLPAFA